MKKTQARRAGARTKAKQGSVAKKTAPRSGAKKAGAKKAGAKKAGARKAGARKAGASSRPAKRVSKEGDDLDIASIERLIQLMADNDLLEIEVRNGPNRRVRLSRRPPDAPPVLISTPGPHVSTGLSTGSRDAPESAVVAPAEAAAEAATAGNMMEFVSPMVGTFYRAPTPESPPYVMAGDRVNGETVLCLIEAMKVMNEIKADVVGEIVDILVENGEAVEFGQPLFLIRKSG